jgi:hypothetical protein
MASDKPPLPPAQGFTRVPRHYCHELAWSRALAVIHRLGLAEAPEDFGARFSFRTAGRLALASVTSDSGASTAGLDWVGCPAAQLAQMCSTILYVPSARGLLRHSVNREIG